MRGGDGSVPLVRVEVRGIGPERLTDVERIAQAVVAAEVQALPDLGNVRGDALWVCTEAVGCEDYGRCRDDLFLAVRRPSGHLPDRLGAVTDRFEADHTRRNNHRDRFAPFGSFEEMAVHGASGAIRDTQMAFAAVAWVLRVEDEFEGHRAVLGKEICQLFTDLDEGHRYNGIGRTMGLRNDVVVEALFRVVDTRSVLPPRAADRNHRRAHRRVGPGSERLGCLEERHGHPTVGG